MEQQQVTSGKITRATCRSASQPHTNNIITTTTPPHHHAPPSPLPPPPPPPSITLPPWDETADKNGVIYEEWEVALLKLLPKKGDLSLCKNWRGICLLDVLSKIVSTVMNARMAIVQEDNGLEATLKLAFAPTEARSTVRFQSTLPFKSERSMDWQHGFCSST